MSEQRLAGPDDTYQRETETGYTVGFRPVEPARDFERLYAWFHNDHLTPYWQLDVDRSEAERLVREKVADRTMTPYIGSLDHVPMSYWEVYEAAEDEIASVYDPAPTDRGIHLFVGPPEYLGHGHATTLLTSLVRFLFEHTDAERLVSEPDVRNDPAIGLFEGCGFQSRGTVELDDKDARLLCCTPASFEAACDTEVEA